MPIKSGPWNGLINVGAVWSALALMNLGYAVAVRELFPLISPGEAAVLEVTTATLMLLIAFRPTLRGRSRSLMLKILLLGGSNAVVTIASLAAYNRLPQGVTTTLIFLGAAAVAFYHIVRSHRWIDLLWPLMALAGVVLVAQPGTEGWNVVGLLWALLAAGCFGFYIVMANSLGAEIEYTHPAEQRLPSLNGAMVLAITVAAVLVDAVVLPWSGVAWMSAPVLGWGAVFGLVALTLPTVLQNLAWSKGMSQRLFGLLSAADPAFAALCGMFLLGQSLTWTEWAGIALACAAGIGLAIRDGQS